MNISKLFASPEQSIKEVMKVIDTGAMGIAFVVDKESKLQGVVTDGDIRRAILKGIGLDEPAHKIMNKDPFYVKISQPIHQITSSEKFSKRFPLPKSFTINLPLVTDDLKVQDVITAKTNPALPDMQNRSVNKILIIGGAGYLGSVLARRLLSKGYSVRVLDNVMYGGMGLAGINSPNFEFINGDIRDIRTLVDAIKGVDAVVHLAAIVGDPASALSPEETLEVNYFATKAIVNICKYNQINRFLFASTCSVYGAGSEAILTEDSDLVPLSLYANTKIESEKAILEEADENFSPTVFRMATLFGLSPRMRFDLVVNLFAAQSNFNKKINVFGGKQWRPHLHVQDAADAYIAALEAPIEKAKGIFNVGGDALNARIIDLADIYKGLFPDVNININDAAADARDYRVSFNKIRDTLKFEPKISLLAGVSEIKKEMDLGKFADWDSETYNNIKYLSKITPPNNEG